MAWDLQTEQRDALAEIYAAFDGVTREGGVSWSEAAVIDGYGTMEERLKARESDTEWNWQELVDDPLWRAWDGFNFLDPIGFRYYLPVALVRCVRDHDDSIDFHLDLDREHAREQAGLLTAAQRNAVRSLILYMAHRADTRQHRAEKLKWYGLLDWWPEQTASE